MENELLRSTREKKLWTQEELAERIGFSRDCVSAYERGERMPSAPALISLSEELGLPVTDLYASIKATFERKQAEKARISRKGSNCHGTK